MHFQENEATTQNFNQQGITALYKLTLQKFYGSMELDILGFINTFLC